MVPYHVHCHPVHQLWYALVVFSSSKMSPRKDNTAVSLLQYLASRERIKVAGFAYGRVQSRAGGKPGMPPQEKYRKAKIITFWDGFMMFFEGVLIV